MFSLIQNRPEITIDAAINASRPSPQEDEATKAKREDKMPLIYLEGQMLGFTFQNPGKNMTSSQKSLFRKANNKKPPEDKSG